MAVLAMTLALPAAAKKKKSADGGEAPRPVSAAVTDSTSAALATIWGAYFRNDIVKEYARQANGDAAIDAYAAGVADAMKMSADKEPYYRGLHQGFILMRNLSTMRQLGVSVNPEVLGPMLAKALKGGDTGFTTESADEFMNRLIAQRMPPDTVSAAHEQAWLDAQFKREGVVKFENGLLLEVLKEGEGPYPTLEDKVTMMYTGRLSDGTVFDSTESPVTFDLVHLVPGFSEGLLRMKPGGRYRLMIPAHLGYGPEGIAGAIPGNAALDFTIDLMSVEKPKAEE